LPFSEKKSPNRTRLTRKYKKNKHKLTSTFDKCRLDKTPEKG